MDVCKYRSNSYDTNNRNKTSHMRPVVASGSAPGLTANFPKIGTVQSQVSTSELTEGLLLPCSLTPPLGR